MLWSLSTSSADLAKAGLHFLQFELVNNEREPIEKAIAAVRINFFILRWVLC